MIILNRLKESAPLKELFPIMIVVRLGRSCQLFDTLNTFQNQYFCSYKRLSTNKEYIELRKIRFINHSIIILSNTKLFVSSNDLSPIFNSVSWGRSNQLIIHSSNYSISSISLHSVNYKNQYQSLAHSRNESNQSLSILHSHFVCSNTNYQSSSIQYL